MHLYHSGAVMNKKWINSYWLKCLQMLWYKKAMQSNRGMWIKRLCSQQHIDDGSLKTYILLRVAFHLTPCVNTYLLCFSAQRRKSSLTQPESNRQPCKPSQHIYTLCTHSKFSFAAFWELLLHLKPIKLTLLTWAWKMHYFWTATDKFGRTIRNSTSGQSIAFTEFLQANQLDNFMNPVKSPRHTESLRTRVTRYKFQLLLIYFLFLDSTGRQPQANEYYFVNLIQYFMKKTLLKQIITVRSKAKCPSGKKKHYMN